MKLDPVEHTVKHDSWPKEASSYHKSIFHLLILNFHILIIFAYAFGRNEYWFIWGCHCDVYIKYLESYLALRCFLSLSKFNACFVDKRLSSSVSCCRIESTIDCIIKEQNNNQNVIFNKTFLFQDIFIILKSNCESWKNHERCHSLGFLSTTS